MAITVNKLTIRAVQSDDLERILTLWRQAGIRSTADDDIIVLRVRLKRDRDLFLVACCESQIVGTLIAGWDGWRATMARLAVDPKYRRLGIAQRLVEQAEVLLKKRGATRAGALVFDDNKIASRFWHAAGYRRQRDVIRFAKDL